jgi:hypothetical protein
MFYKPMHKITSRPIISHCVLALCAVLTGRAPACAHKVFSFEGGREGWHLGTVAVGNVDGDPLLEIIVPYRDSSGPASQWYLDAFKPDGTRLNGFPYRGGVKPINVSPTLYDLDGDGRSEIIFTCGHEVVALRGDGTVLWSTAVFHENYVPDAGYQAVTNGFYWSWDGQWRDRLPATSEFSSEVSPPIIADVDGTGTLKVVTAWKIDPDRGSTAQDYNPFIRPLFGFGEWGTVGDVWSGGVVFMEAGSGRKDFIYHIHQLVEAGLSVGRSRSAGAPLVYVLNDSDSVVAFDKTRPYGLWGNEMLHKQFGKNQRLQSGSYLKGVDVYATDLDGDGEEEVLVPTTQLDPLWQPADTVLDDDGAILWREWKDSSHVSVVHGWLNSACMIPVNPDRDHRIDVFSFTHSYEIAFRFWNGIRLVDHPGWPKDFSPRVPTPPVVGDIDGDGEEEVLIGTYDPAARPSSGKLHIFALDGREKLAIDVPGGLKHIPALADVDNDGSIDLIYRSMTGRIYIHNFGAGPGSRVSWATHRGNMRRDGNRGVPLFPEGTPIVVRKEAGYRRAQFGWALPAGGEPARLEIFRSEHAEGPYLRVAALPSSARSFTDSGLRDGWLYFYEVRAIYQDRTVSSAPFAILSFANNNLVANPGFEEDDDSRWDKWFTGDIPWQNMTGSDDQPYAGKQSMEIKLVNHRSNSSIKQSNQYGTPDPAIRVVSGKFYSFGGFLRSGGLSKASRHWFEWNTTRTGENTGTIPGLPWPVYFTPHWAIGTESVPWTYLNRVFTMPDGFPNVELRHRFTIEEAGSGSVFIDNVFFRELPPPSDPLWQEIIPFESEWRYSAEPPPPLWQNEEADLSSWAVGRGKFGGGTGTQAIATPLPLKKEAYYFSRRFNVPGWAREELLLAARATDDFNGKVYPLRIWLNGTELNTSGIDAVTGNGNEVKYYDLLPFSDLLQPGPNTIAVMLQNGWASDWDNVAFDLSLRAVRAGAGVTGPAQFNSIQPQPDGGIELHLSGPRGSAWRLECTESPHPGAVWRLVESVTFDSAAGVWVVDRGQNGQSHPQQAGTRFYRLVSQ